MPLHKSQKTILKTEYKETYYIKHLRTNYRVDLSHIFPLAQAEFYYKPKHIHIEKFRDLRVSMFPNQSSAGCFRCCTVQLSLQYRLLSLPQLQQL